ncbi:MAG: hypothetical protein ABSG68_10015 [Thermoguttaceae bacterium]|jgi:hypothetical protein
MTLSQAFSIGADKLFRDLRAYSVNGIACSPRTLDRTAVRRRSNEVIGEWFRRVIDDYAAGSPKSCAVEDNIAVFAVIQWRERLLTYANIQVLVADCDLDDYYLGQPAVVEYLRLDLDKETLGKPFSHPVPHLHVGEGCSARFSLDGGNSANIVADFVEFVYRHYAPLQWRRWVEREWNEHFADVSPADADDENPLARIFDAFDTNQFDILRTMADTVAELKGVLRQRKDQAFRLHVSRSDRELLEYPAAR